MGSGHFYAELIDDHVRDGVFRGRPDAAFVHHCEPKSVKHEVRALGFDAKIRDGRQHHGNSKLDGFWIFERRKLIGCGTVGARARVEFVFEFVCPPIFDVVFREVVLGAKVRRDRLGVVAVDLVMPEAELLFGEGNGAAADASSLDVAASVGHSRRLFPGKKFPYIFGKNSGISEIRKCGFANIRFENIYRQIFDSVVFEHFSC